MVRFGDLLVALDPSEFVVIRGGNAVFFQDQIERFVIAEYPHIEDVSVLKVRSRVEEISKETYPMIAIDLDYKVSFEKREMK